MCMQSERYFGKEGPSMKASRKVRQLPVMTTPKDAADLTDRVDQINLAAKSMDSLTSPIWRGTQWPKEFISIRRVNS